MMGFGFGGLGMIFMLIFWVAIIALAVWLLSNVFPKAVNNLSSPDGTRRSDLSESPLEILKQRYARGEINREQYETMKQDIK